MFYDSGLRNVVVQSAEVWDSISWRRKSGVLEYSAKWVGHGILHWFLVVRRIGDGRVEEMEKRVCLRLKNLGVLKRQFC